MRSQAQTFVLLFSLLIAMATPITAAAQAPGYADITTPRLGESIFGLVTIEGSAAHPSFMYYELTFAHQPNPTDTWFPIMQPVRTPVSEGRLALWDTTGITDGTYQLRLQVWLESGNNLESIVRDLNIRNMSPTVIPTTIPEGEPISSIQIEPTATLEVIPSTTTQRRETSRVIRNFVIGGILSIVGMLSVGGYLFIRRSMQMRVAKLRMRQVHRKFEIQRGRRKK